MNSLHPVNEELQISKRGMLNIKVRALSCHLPSLDLHLTTSAPVGNESILFPEIILDIFLWSFLDLTDLPLTTNQRQTFLYPSKFDLATSA